MPVISLLIIALMVFALIDVIRRDDSEVKFMPKWVWLLLVVLLPFLGSVLWFALGREYPEGGMRLPRPETRVRPTAPTAPSAPYVPLDTRTTEQQIADLDREIEEWRLREEIEKRKRERGQSEGGSSAGSASAPEQ